MDANLNGVLEQGFSCLEQGQWEEGRDTFEKVLKDEPECALAHVGKLMADLQVSKKENLADLEKPFDSNNNFKRVVKYADEELKAEIEGYNNRIYERVYGPDMEYAYREAVALMNIGEYTDAIEKFEQIKTYKNSVRLMVNCKKEIESGKKENIYNEACMLLEYACGQIDIDDAVQKFVSVISWKDSKKKIEECGQKAQMLKNLSPAQLAELKQKKQEYQVKVSERKAEEERERAFRKANLIIESVQPVVEEVVQEEPVVETYEEPTVEAVAESLAESVEEPVAEPVEEAPKEEHYEETYEEPVVHEQDYNDIERVESTEFEEYSHNSEFYDDNEEEVIIPKKKSSLRFLVTLLAVGIIGIILVLVGIIVGVLEYNYRGAMDLMEDGYYVDAKQKFETFSFYRDSAEMVNECEYKRASKLLEADDYDSAKVIFRNLGEYSDSKDMVFECDYQKATDLLEVYDYQGAKSIYESISNYKDSDEMVSECDYRRAVELMEYGNLDEAESLFRFLGDYKNCRSMVDLIVTEKKYTQAIDYYRDGYYTAAKNLFNEISNHEDSAKYIRLINVHTGLSRISSIYDLVGFEDADDLILDDDDQLQDFLMGNWRNSAGRYIEFEKHSDGVIWCSYNIPTTSGEHFKIENGYHYKGDNYYGWTIQWSYTLIDEDTIKVYCYKDSTYYELKRQ